MLEDTPVEEAAGATITPADDDSELSDNDMERLMNMNLDDLIDDVKADTDSISIDDLLNQGDELKRAEAQAQAQALEEELAEKEKNDSQVNETEAGNEGAVSDIENRQDADNKEADNKEPEKKESVQVDESKIKPEKPKKDSFFKKIKKVFFDSLEDESPKEEAADNGNGENTSSEDKSADKPEADNGEPKDENEQIIEDVFGLSLIHI